MVMVSTLIPACWFIYIIANFYLIRRIRTIYIRAVLCIIPGSILLYIGCHNLPYFHMTSVVLVSLYWLIFIRLFHLIVLSPDEINSLALYAWKFLWFILPIIPSQKKTPIYYCLIFAAGKLILNHWIYQWLRACEPNDSYGRIYMFYINICTGTFMNDIQIFITRLVTFDKYSLLEFNNFPLLSKTVREFWGRRYNLLVSTFLKESVFEPVSRLPNSSMTIGALASFIASGLLHGHVAVAAFGASSPLPAFIFFTIQGVACSIETKCPFRVPRLIAILLTQTFLMLTAPLYLGLFTRAPSEFFEHNKPPFIDATWLPKLPIPSFCPKA